MHFNQPLSVGFSSRGFKICLGYSINLIIVFLIIILDQLDSGIQRDQHSSTGGGFSGIFPNTKLHVL